jgi:transposase
LLSADIRPVPRFISLDLLPKAITAMAHRLARIIWHLLTHRVPFDLSIFAACEKANQVRRLKRLSSAARQMGYQLSPIAT